jgi:transposase-like protein
MISPPDPLDEDFPLGDGSADLDATVVCPHCAEEATIALDPGSGASQSYVEDCPVCCQPWQVDVRYDSDGHATVSVRSQDE